MIYIRELAPDDAGAIGRIESSLHPAEVADGGMLHSREMDVALLEGVNLSFGIFDDDRLVGYLLSYGFEPTAFVDQHGDAVYIEDIAVLPRYRRMVAKLIKRFTAEVTRHFPDAAVEAHSLHSVFELWQRHADCIRRFGFEMTRAEATGEILEGEARYRIRWEHPVNHTASTKNLDNLLASLPSHDMTLDGTTYSLKVVREEAHWESLRAVWDQLLLATPEHTVFQSYRYQRLWWRHFGGDADLFIVLIVRDGEVVGLAPLQIATAKIAGRYCRQLGFIGSRWEVDRPTCFFPEQSDQLWRVLVRYLAHRAGTWDICDFHEQITDSANLRTLQDAFRAEGYLIGTAPDSDCAYLDMSEGTWAEFLAAKSALFRKNLKTAGRRLQALGTVQYRTYTAAADVAVQLERYRDIEARSWKQAKGVGVSRDEHYFGFYREMAATFAEDEGFVVRMVTVDDATVAGTFGLQFDGVFYSLQIAHDQAFNRCSPGTYLEALEMEQCFGEGFREYEFLGGFLNNKSRWTQTFRHTTQLFIYRPTPFFRALYHWRFGVKPWLKALKGMTVTPRDSAAASASEHD